MRRLTAAALVFAGAFAAAGFTALASDARIETRVDARIRAMVGALADSLQREGVPAEPMIDYALEGTQKRGAPEVILGGVHKWAADLRRARRALGPNATPAEITAGAKALRAGADEQSLTRLRDRKGDVRYASALNTVAYIIPLGVPADTATTILVNLALASATDAQLAELQAAVERDIGAGTPAGASAVARAVGVLRAIEAAADGVAPGAALPSTRGTARPSDPMANPTLRGSAVGSQGDAVRPPAPRGKDNKRP